MVVRSGEETGGEVLELESLWARPGHRAPAHLHPEQEERFEILEGAARIRIGEEERDLGVGDVAVVPPGTVHLAWNPTVDPVRLLLTFRPALRWLEFVERLFALAHEGRAGDPAALIELMAEFPREIAPPPELR